MPCPHIGADLTLFSRDLVLQFLCFIYNYTFIVLLGHCWHLYFHPQRVFKLNRAKMSFNIHFFVIIFFFVGRVACSQENKTTKRSVLSGLFVFAKTIAKAKPKACVCVGVRTLRIKPGRQKMQNFYSQFN